MSAIVLPANPDNWQELYSTHIEAQPGTLPNSWIPIKEIRVPLPVASDFVAVYVSSQNTKPSWHFGGFLSQKIRLALDTGGNPDVTTSELRKVRLNEITVIRFPYIGTDGYGLYLYPPYWLQNITFICWEWIGPALP